MKTQILPIALTILALAYGTTASAAVPGAIMKFQFENSLEDSVLQTHQAGIDGDVTFQNSAPDTAGGPVSVRFSGTPPSRVIITNSADLNMNAGVTFSIAAWIKTDFTSGDRVIVAKSAASGDLCGAHTAALMVDGGGNLRYDNFCVNEVHSVALIRDGQWHHIGMSYDGTTYRLYVDGALDGVKSFPGAAEGSRGEPPWQFTIGQSLNPTFPTGVFKGDVDDVTFWNVALTDKQFLEHYLQRAPAVGVRITQQPVNRTVLSGATATFAVGATIRGADPTALEYQWQKNMADVSGATNATYTTPATTLADSGARYRVVVSAPGATPVTSSEATLNVVPRESVAGPLAWLDFENRLEDQSFLGTHDGTAMGGFAFAMSSPTNIAGNSSGLFNGTDSRVDLANGGDLNINAGNPFTISAWISTDFSDGLRVIAAKSAASGDLCGARTGALMVDDAGNLRYDNFCVNELHSSVVVRDGQWHHIALTYDGTTYRLYVDGTLDASKSFPGSAEGSRGEPPWTFTIGQTLNPTFPTGVFKGNIDEVAFWNIALSPSQIVAVSTEGVPRAGVGIISQPADQTAFVGQTATFAVVASASGAPPEAISYQWQKNMASIPDATNASYTTPILALADDGSRYRVVVSLPGVSTNESREAILTVLPVEPVPGALAWIDFENRLDDQSFLGTHDGTAVGGFSFEMNTPNSTAGSSSGLFNGNDSRVGLANSADLRINSGDAFTITAWIKTDFSDGLRIIAAKSAATGDLCGGRTGAFFVDDLGSLRWDSFCLNEVHSSTPVRNGQWNHVAVTYDGGTYRLYVNGRLDGTKTFGGAAEGTEAWTSTIGQTLNPTFPTGRARKNQK